MQCISNFRNIVDSGIIFKYDIRYERIFCLLFLMVKSMHKSIQVKYFDFLKSFLRHDKQGNNGNEEKFKGIHVKNIRKKFNLSQKSFASMLDISVKTLQNYEIDRYSIPSTAKSLFIFAYENIELFKKYYLSKVKNLEPYRVNMNTARRNNNYIKKKD